MRFRPLSIAVLLALTTLTAPLYAITAGDVLRRMDEKQQYGYITGAIDMALYLEQVSTRASTPRSACILEWYYGKNAPGPRQVVQLFDGNQDKSAVGLIKILIERACGKRT
jgi:hypothetical protein